MFVSELSGSGFDSSCSHFINCQLVFLVLISKDKIKGKSKCAICLTERSFIHKIKGKYDLESELEIYLQFFND